MAWGFDTTVADTSSYAGPENTVNDSFRSLIGQWSNAKNLKSYNKNPLVSGGTTTLGLLGVSPYSYIDHIQKSTPMDVPYNVTAQQRYDAAYNKAIDFYNRTNLNQQGPLGKFAGALTLSAAGTGHQLRQGIEHMWQPGPSQTTTDDWSPNFVDWLGNMRAVWNSYQGNP